MAKSFRSPAKIARRLKLLPMIRREVKTWPAFMYNYALGLTPRRDYVFRNGARLKLSRGIDHAVIVEIFLRQDYGEMPDDAVIVDLGASIGVFTIYATTTARNVTVYAYEPLQDYYNLMKENVALNRQNESVHCFNAAVAGEATIRNLYLKGTDFFFPTLVGKEANNGQDAIQIQCTTLAAIIEDNQLDRIDVLKIDCEGAEYEILRFTPAQYFERIREIRMEYHNLDQEQHHLNRLREFLTKKGYTITHTHATSETNGSLWARR